MSLSRTVLVVALPSAVSTAPSSNRVGPPAPARASMSEPAISPDGREIAFVSGGDIWTVPVSGGEAHLLVSHAAYDSRPLYSPDGARLAFRGRGQGFRSMTIERAFYRMAAMCFVPIGFGANLQDSGLAGETGAPERHNVCSKSARRAVGSGQCGGAVAPDDVVCAGQFPEHPNQASAQ